MSTCEALPTTRVIVCAYGNEPVELYAVGEPFRVQKTGQRRAVKVVREAWLAPTARMTWPLDEMYAFTPDAARELRAAFESGDRALLRATWRRQARAFTPDCT